MKCRLCNFETTKVFSAKVLNQYEIEYFICSNCDLLQTESPYWLEEAYENPINDTDTGLLDRNIKFAEKVKSIIYFFFKRDGNFLDYAAGYGVFTRLMRDIGFNFYWNDPYTENLFAKGFEYNNGDLPVELITSFESFEHFVNPMEEINKMRQITGNIIFSTNLYPDPLPNPSDWWYYGLEHGQYVAFYSRRTLKYIADELNLNFLSCSKYLHLFSEERINEKYFNFIFKKSSYFNKYINKKLKSKTFSDSRKIST